MRTKKGEYGYVRSQKLIRFLRTLGLFAVALSFFIVGFVLNGGDRKNIYTVIAMVGCIPASMSMVSMIMIWMRKPVARDVVDAVSEHAGSLSVLYELFVTTRDISIYFDASVITHDYCMIYCSSDVKQKDINFMETHMTKIFRAEGYQMKVKIYTQLKNYLDRVDDLREKSEDEDRDRIEALGTVLKAAAL